MKLREVDSLFKDHFTSAISCFLLNSSYSSRRLIELLDLEVKD